MMSRVDEIQATNEYYLKSGYNDDSISDIRYLLAIARAAQAMADAIESDDCNSGPDCIHCNAVAAYRKAVKGE